MEAWVGVGDVGGLDDEDGEEKSDIVWKRKKGMDVLGQLGYVWGVGCVEIARWCL